MAASVLGLVEKANDTAKRASTPEEFKVALDAHIEAFAEAERLAPAKLTQFETQFFHCLLRAHELYRPRPDENIADALAKGDVAIEVRRLWAASLLRIGGTTQLFQRHAFLRPRTLKLAEDALVEFVKIEKLDSKSQTHETLQRLYASVRRLESALESASISDIGVLPDLRQRYLKLINQPSTATFISAFVPKTITESLGALIKEACEWIEDPTIWTTDRLDLMATRGEEVIEATSRCNTRYAELVSSSAKSVIRTLRVAFDSSPASRPPTISILAADKKYPLHQGSVHIWLSFQIENSGPGEAFDFAVDLVELAGARSDEESTYIGRLAANVRHDFDIGVKLAGPVESLLVELRATWRTARGLNEVQQETFELMAQSTTVNWDTFAYRNLYSSEPVTTTNELVGRTTILDDLFSRVIDDQVGSSYVWGQKRVGKTSIAKTLATRLGQVKGAPIVVVYLEAGAFAHATAEGTVARLGNLACERIRSVVPALKALPLPEFRDSLSPMGDYLTAARDIVPSLRVVLILDEFDEIPRTLYRITPEANYFFLAIRSISGLGYCGFILVGGEKMQYVINYQGEKLNKFKSFRVDYFNRQTQAQDFAELVRKPIEGKIEVSDAALEVMFEYGAGNPFFTKLIAQQMLRICVERRNAFVSDREMQLAAMRTVDESGSHVFQHFWDDGIFDEGNRHEELSLARKRSLVALSTELHNSGSFDLNSVLEKRLNMPPDTFRRQVQDFTRRGVLEERNGKYWIRLGLFRDWLRRGGSAQLITTVDYDELRDELQEHQSAQRTSPRELTELVERWGIYKGKRIGEEHLRAWLDQFDTTEERRLAFKIASNVKFYQNAEVRIKLKEAYQIIEQSTPGLTLSGTRQKRREFLVSYLNGPGKSGTRYAKQFAEVNNIYADSIVEAGAISERIAANPQAQVLVFLDDISGSGQSLKAGLRDLEKVHGEALRARGVRVHVFYITGFLDVTGDIEDAAEEFGLNVRISVLDPLTEADRAFSDKSQRFGDDLQRRSAKEMAMKYGARLGNHPLGFNKSELLITFEHNCPNNSLPILWSNEKNWLPLFER